MFENMFNIGFDLDTYLKQKHVLGVSLYACGGEFWWWHYISSIKESRLSPSTDYLQGTKMFCKTSKHVCQLIGSVTISLARKVYKCITLQFFFVLVAWSLLNKLRL